MVNTDSYNPQKQNSWRSSIIWKSVKGLGTAGPASLNTSALGSKFKPAHVVLGYFIIYL